MRVLLDENFPDPPGFEPSDLDAHFHVVSLHAHAPELAGNRTPDWLLYLEAQRAGFDALVTRDWRQSAQAEELWVATRTEVSVITWRRPQDDPVVEWGQLLAYMPQLRRLRSDLGPSIFLLPAPTLTPEHHVRKASDRLGELASEQGRARQELIHEAQVATRSWLDLTGRLQEFASMLDL